MQSSSARMHSSTFLQGRTGACSKGVLNCCCSAASARSRQQCGLQSAHGSALAALAWRWCPASNTWASPSTAAAASQAQQRRQGWLRGGRALGLGCDDTLTPSSRGPLIRGPSLRLPACGGAQQHRNGKGGWLAAGRRHAGGDRTREVRAQTGGASGRARWHRGGNQTQCGEYPQRHPSLHNDDPTTRGVCVLPGARAD